MNENERVGNKEEEKERRGRQERKKCDDTKTGRGKGGDIGKGERESRR